MPDFHRDMKADTDTSYLLRRWLAFIILVVVGAALVRFVSQPASITDLLNEGQAAFVAGDFDQAAALAERVLQRDPDRVPGLHLAGRIALERGEFQRALQYFDRIPDEQSIGAIQARMISGEIRTSNLHNLSSAEDQFRRALALEPQNALANDRLGYLLGLSGRSWEALPYRLNTIAARRADRLQVFVVALGDLARENPDDVAAFHAADPDDPLAQLAMALQAMDDRDVERASDLLRNVIATRPDLLEAHVRLGRLLLEHGAFSDIADWNRALPDGAEQHPGVWTVRGLWAQRRGQDRPAVRCLWEAVRRDPNSQDANYQLGQSLRAIGREDAAPRFLKRASELQDYLFAVHQVHGGTLGQDERQLQSAAEAAARLGLVWETLAWSRFALEQDPASFWARRLVDETLPLTKDSSGVRCLPVLNPAVPFDFSREPLPDYAPVSSAAPAVTVAESGATGIRFENRESEAGVEFRYFNGGDPATPHVIPLQEQTGGGVAAFDYDADNWPDLYFTQGSAWPPDATQLTHLDRLFRNRGNGSFADVTAAIRAAENGFSQGISSGDINDDGFPDLFIANIGTNRLLMNNGDGTFSDSTVAAVAAHADWTTSCLIGDLNGDALPDLYAVNYLAGDDVFTRVCRNPDGSQRPCAIQGFDGAPDRLYLNQGDGRFEDATDACGLSGETGRGMGIIAADFDGAGRPSLYVANDVGPNFLWSNDAPRGSPLRFTDMGVPASVAVNEFGQYEAGMGIATGDANNDGRLDLFVTNFERESNTLYRYEGGGLFAVATREAGLKDGRTDWLGFGTQFLDADRDGDLDLVLTNGHVDDNRHLDRPYQMPPQLFSNMGNGTFTELTDAGIGRYFEERYLGRGLARVDWNRDGLDEFVVSHLDQPAALLANVTPTDNGFVAVHLRGRYVDRDAIATTVSVTIDGTPQMRQLTAGDGYQACNQKRLLFGVPSGRTVENLEVRWATGAVQTFTDVPVNSELIIVEGRPKPLALSD